MVNKKKSGKKNGKIRQELLWSVSISAVRAWRTLSAKSMRKQSKKVLRKSWEKRFNFRGRSCYNKTRSTSSSSHQRAFRWEVLNLV